MKQTSAVTITPFTTEYTDQVITLIVGIQQKEFNLPITAADQPDLADIANFYQQDNGNFWLALDDGKVVGTIALIDIDNKQVALRKMFVHRDYRGREIGTAHKLLQTLFAWVESKKVCSIYLGTTAKMHAAQKFYVNCGFVEINKCELPDSFPVMSVDTKFYLYENTD